MQDFRPPPPQVIYVQQPKKGAGCLSVVVVLIFLFVVLPAIWRANRPTGGDNTPAAQEAPRANPQIPTNLPTWPADDLVALYKQNEVAADESAKGRWLKVSGTVDAIGKDILGTPYVTLRADKADPSRMVQCMFPSSQAPKLAELKPGQKVIVRGKVSGMMMNVIVRECDLVEE